MNVLTPNEVKDISPNRKKVLMNSEMELFKSSLNLFLSAHSPDHDGCYRHRYKIREECATGILEFSDDLNKEITDCLATAGWKNIKVEFKAGAYMYVVFKP